MDKKELIINAAIKLFGEKGIEKTKISDIAKEAKIAQGTFYLYFPSKLSVMPSIVEVMIKEMSSALKANIDKNQPFPKKLEQMIDIIFETTCKNNQLVGIIYAGLSASDFLADWVDAYEPYYTWLTNILEDAEEHNEIELVIGASSTAEIIFGLIESAAERAYLFDKSDEHKVKEDKKEILAFIEKSLTR